MGIIKKYIKKLYHFLKVHRVKWLIFFLITFLFFLIRFPYEEAMSYLMIQLQEQTKSSIQLRYDSFYINPLGPALVFNNPKIITPANQRTFTAQQLILRPSYKSLLQLKEGVIITLKWPGSILKSTIRKKQIKKDLSGWLFQLKAHNFNPSLLSAFVSIFSKTKGTINIDTEIFIDSDFETQPIGSWSLNGENIYSQAFSYTFPNGVDVISLPDFKWSRIHSTGEIKKGEITIANLSFGEKKDVFKIKSRGIISVDFKKQGLPKKTRPIFKNYNFGLDISIGEDWQQLERSLDLLLKNIKSKTPQGWHYLGHLKGNTANFLNPPTPVSKLPTLQEIQNPVEEDETF